MDIKQEQHLQDIKRYVIRRIRQFIGVLLKKLMNLRALQRDEKLKKILTKEEISNNEELVDSCYACQIAYFFNQRLKENNLLKEMQPLFYAHLIFYTLQKPFYGMNKVYGLTYIQIQQYKCQKFSNNCKYIDPEKYYYSSFRHFSFEVSKENLVIMDLYLAHNIFSDLSIQTEESWKKIIPIDLIQESQILKLPSIKNAVTSVKNYSSINQKSKINQIVYPPDQIKIFMDML
ncbi:unnamed protein product [Paramecium sonneborni]|uniref:Alpha-type protein kinase domain-containing protein n=1 Tax=Paramecium sonneborni TaxID=65129 RepID=A0A8S1RNN6_9CILI|nr:unnamed protein product [Paramecium sonneborni]